MHAFFSRLAWIVAVVVPLMWSADAHAQCQSNADCKGDRVCAGGVCDFAQPAQQTCEKDMDCPGDQICSAGMCSTAGAPPTAPPVNPAPLGAAGESCRAARDCRPELQCRANTCVDPAAPPPANAGYPPATGSPATPGYPAGFGSPPGAGAAYGATAADTGTKTEKITGLIVAGAVVLGSVWALTIVTAAVTSAVTDSNRTGKNIAYAAIPIAGPLISLADPDNDTEDYAVALVASTIVQTGGLTMLILGLTLEREVPVSSAALGGADGGSLHLATGPVPMGTGAGWALTLTE